MIQTINKIIMIIITIFVFLMQLNNEFRIKGCKFAFPSLFLIHNRNRSLAGNMLNRQFSDTHLVPFTGNLNLAFHRPDLIDVVSQKPRHANEHHTAEMSGQFPSHHHIRFNDGERDFVTALD